MVAPERGDYAGTRSPGEPDARAALALLPAAARRDQRRCRGVLGARLWRRLPTPVAAQRVRNARQVVETAPHPPGRRAISLPPRPPPRFGLTTATGHARSQLDRLVHQLAEAAPAEDPDAPAESEPEPSPPPPDAAILLALPGIGTGSALACLLAEGSDALRRRDYAALRCLCGVAPHPAGSVDWLPTTTPPTTAVGQPPPRLSPPCSATRELCFLECSARRCPRRLRRSSAVGASLRPRRPASRPSRHLSSCRYHADRSVATGSPAVHAAHVRLSTAVSRLRIKPAPARGRCRHGRNRQPGPAGRGTSGAASEGAAARVGRLHAWRPRHPRRSPIDSQDSGVDGDRRGRGGGGGGSGSTSTTRTKCTRSSDSGSTR